MSSASVMAAIARADFLERVRTYAYLVTLAAVLWLGYGTYTGFVAVRLADYRGVLNSAWVGGMTALIAVTFLSLAGFYVVKNAVQRDRTTGVGQILATTPMRRTWYTLGKTLSNFAVLVTMVLILALTAILLQLVGREDPRFDVAALLSPFLFSAVPAMAVVAAITVLAETTPWLSGSIGNVAWFFVWGALLTSSFTLQNAYVDPTGVIMITNSMMEAARAQVPGYKADLSITIQPTVVTEGTFLWTGVQWTGAYLASRLAWIAGALGIALFAALPFDRFDTSRARRSRSKKGRGAEADAAAAAGAGARPEAARVRGAWRWPSIPRIPLPGVLGAEFRLLTGGVNRWWLLVGLGLWIASLVAPLSAAHGGLLPALWAWPILLWSGMGGRERRYDTEAFVFTSSGALTRQLPAAWLAGVLLAFLLASAVAFRLLVAGDFGSLAALIAGALFVPSMALAAGVWSGGGKLFEILYTILWYVGPANRAAALDYSGATRTTPAGVTGQSPAVWFALAAFLLAAAFVGRLRRMRA